jgi:rhodanese-related sulfurtransferase
MTDITAEELKERMGNNEQLHIIDVREPYEYEESNIGAMLIPLGDLPGRIDELDELHGQEVIVHCKSGARSAAAKAFMVQNGFTNVRNLLGGILAYKALN